MVSCSSLCRSSLVVAGALLIVVAAGVSASGQKAAPVNAVPLTVRTPHSGFNRMVVTVTICEPGTARCATIDNVMVDTGSTGLRLEASAVPASLRWPAFTGAGDKPLAECLRFLHDDAWGPLVHADLRIGGMTAMNLPIQIIADDGRPQPEACPASGVKPTSNGTLGIGPYLFDCQGACVQSARNPGVFVADGDSWSPVQGPVPPQSRLPNPVSRFAEHGNGIVIDLPLPPAGGADDVVGSLTFGAGTAANNQLGMARIIRLDRSGRFTTVFGGVAYPDSYIDSGTETYILNDGGLPRCTGMSWAYCPSPDRILDATIVGADEARVAVSFKVGDYRAALDRRVGAWDGFAEAAEPASRSFVWGAPLFFGRRIVVVHEGQPVPGIDGATGPLYAIQP
ncbi:MAG: DUF3443 family protein [Microvirga sp.]